MVHNPVAFGRAKHQLYESQALPVSLSLLVVFNSNARIKPHSMSIGRIGIKSLSSKSKNETFQFFITYICPSINNMRIKSSSISID